MLKHVKRKSQASDQILHAQVRRRTPENLKVELGGIDSNSTILASASLSQIAPLRWSFVKSACWPVLADAGLFYRVG